MTHAGRPGVDDDHSRQTETLTAPISVLGREEKSLTPAESAPIEGPAVDVATGAIDTDDDPHGDDDPFGDDESGSIRRPRG